MKCLKFGCTQEAFPPFPCCQITHGVKHRDDLKQYKDYIETFYSLRDWSASLWPVEKWIYYHSIARV